MLFHANSGDTYGCRWIDCLYAAPRFYIVTCVGAKQDKNFEAWEAKTMKTENISSFGTVLASFLAASCCIGPAIFVIFGTSAGFLGNLAFIEPWRPYLLGVAVVLFGFSFWKLYLKKPDCSCEEDLKARKIARGILWIGAVAFVLSASFQSILIKLYQ